MEWSGRRPTRFKRPDSAGARPRMMGLAQSSGATRTTLSRELTLRNQLATMFGFTSTTQVTHSHCQAHPLPVSRSFACSPTRLVNRFQSKGCRCAPMRSRQSCAIMYHGERCSSCRNATCVASTALRFLAPRRRLAAGSIVASKHASVARLIHNMRVGEASDVVRRAVRRGGGVRSPESAPTSDVRDV